MKAISRFSSFYILLVLALLASPVSAQHDGHGHDGHNHGEEGHEHSHNADSGVLAGCGDHAEDGTYDPVSTVMHHIGDANEFHLWKNVHIPLPLFLYAPETGWTMGTSSLFHHGHSAYDRYVLNEGRVNRIVDADFPMGEVEIQGILHKVETVTDEKGKTKEKEVYYACAKGDLFKLDKPSTLDGGALGGGITSFYDFSMTKNVFTMLLASILLILIWSAVARGYKRNEGKAPSGIQSFFEPFFTFIRDEVTEPMIGPKYERFQPFIMTLFFFILFSNLLGLIPFFPGGANVTGNLAVTFVLAVLAFIVTNIHGNGHYWSHILWMPGVPTFVKPILTIVEVMGLFIKPFSLMIRLFANITAGHIIILSLIGLIFVFGENGTNVGGAAGGALIGGLFTAFMNLIELLVAFLQAFIFAILTASYIGAAVEEHEHNDHEHAH